jgi:hypothetical protein
MRLNADARRFWSFTHDVCHALGALARLTRDDELVQDVVRDERRQFVG